MAQAKYDFGEQFQASILSLILRDPSFGIDYRDSLDPVFFEDPHHSTITQIALQYLDRKGHPPELQVLQHELSRWARQYGVDEQDSLTLLKKATFAYTRPPTDDEYVRGRALEFAQTQAIKTGVRRAADMLYSIEKGKANGSGLVDVRSTLERSLRIGLNGVHDLGMSMGKKPGTLPKYIRKAYAKGQTIPTGFPSLDRMMRGGLGRGEVGIIFGPPKRGKPGWIETPVLMADGSRKRLGDIGVGDRIINRFREPTEVIEVHEQGKLDAVLIETAAGRSLVFAPDHPFLTTEGWKDAGKLSPGDVLAEVHCPFLDLSGDLSVEEAELLGYFVGDGSISCGAANVTSADREILDRVIFLGRKLGFSVTERKYEYEYQMSKASRLCFSDGVRPWLRKHGLFNITSHYKRVPAAVFTSSSEAQAAFLGAYFACDGSIFSHNKSGNFRLEYYSVSRGLLEDVQHLLLRFGISASIHQKNGRYQGNKHESWRMKFQDRKTLGKFASRIPVFGKKRAVLDECKLMTFDDPGLVGDEVVAVSPHERVECRCLTVAEGESFTACDLVVHNSTVLVNMGSWASKMGFMVIHYSFELRQADVVLKYACRATGMTDQQIMDLNTPADINKFEKRCQQWYGSGSPWVVYERPGQVGVEWIRSHLSRLNSVHNVKPDLILIDFMDRMAKKDPSNLYVEGGTAMEKLTALGADFNAGVWTASQAGRQAEDKDVVRQSDASESWRKMADCDISVSLNQTIQEKIEGLITLFVTGQRRGMDTRYIHCTIDYPRSFVKEKEMSERRRAKRNEDEKADDTMGKYFDPKEAKKKRKRKS